MHESALSPGESWRRWFAGHGGLCLGWTKDLHNGRNSSSRGYPQSVGHDAESAIGHERMLFNKLERDRYNHQLYSLHESTISTGFIR